MNGIHSPRSSSSYRADGLVTIGLSKRGRQLVRRFHVGRGIQNVRDLVRVFLLDAREREGGESSSHVVTLVARGNRITGVAPFVIAVGECAYVGRRLRSKRRRDNKWNEAAKHSRCPVVDSCGSRAGHFPNMEQPDAFNSAVVEFLSATPRTDERRPASAHFKSNQWLPNGFGGTVCK
jgi:pimeloyl-ACP methyl ester carboxylesterase